MSGFRWYRWLRGGMWMQAWHSWHHIRPEKYAYLIGLDIFSIESHRWPWQFKQVPQEPAAAPHPNTKENN